MMKSFVLKITICLTVFVCGTLSAWAVGYEFDKPSRDGEQATYNGYHSTIYAPGATEVVQHARTTYSTPDDDANSSRGPRRVIIDSEDPGKPSDESPIGEAWVLLFFAIAYAAYRVRRVRHSRCAEA